MDKTEQDALLYKNWEKTRSKKDFQQLYRHMLPVIAKASQKAAYNSQVPQAVFKLEAAQQFHNAVSRFDPKFGVKLSTYAHRTIEDKLKRVNYLYQNINRISERKKGQAGVYEINDLLNTEYMLKDKLGRDASDVEIGAEMGFTPENIGRLRSELRRDLSLNAELDSATLAGEEDMVTETEYMVYYDLPPEAQLVYDLARGMHGKKALLKANGRPDYIAIGRQLGFADGKVRKLTKSIGQALKPYHM